MSLGGPTTTTNFNQQQNQQQQQQQQGANFGQSTSTPNLPGWLSQYYQNIPGLYNSLTGPLQSMASKPLYGPQQQANFQQGLNQQLAQAGQNINSQLAARGALNSGRAAQAQTGLALGGAQELGNYLANVPIQNFQAQQSALGQLGNVVANQANYRPPVIGQTTDTSQLMNMLSNLTGQSNTSGQQTQQTSQNLFGALLPSLLGAGLNMLTGGLGSVLGGGGFGAGASQALNTAPTFAPGSNPSPYGFANQQSVNPNSDDMFGQLIQSGGFGVR